MVWVRRLASRWARYQRVDCARLATRREVWSIDEASVVVRLCGRHAFQGSGTWLVSGERWATRARSAVPVPLAVGEAAEQERCPSIAERRIALNRGQEDSRTPSSGRGAKEGA